MTKTSSHASVKLAAAVVVALILVYTMVCLLTGNLTPVCRVTAMLMPLWLSAELVLLCSTL